MRFQRQSQKKVAELCHLPLVLFTPGEHSLAIITSHELVDFLSVEPASLRAVRSVPIVKIDSVFVQEVASLLFIV